MGSGNYFYPGAALRGAFLNLSGGTVTGDTFFTQGLDVISLRATNLSATTLYSGSTNVSSLFARIADVVALNNITTLHTAQLLTKANLSGASFTGIINSGGTNLDALFAHKSELALTNALNTLQTAQLLTKTDLSGATFTGEVNMPTIQSGGTNLDALFAHKSELSLTNANVTLHTAQLLTKANLSGATFTGTVNIPSLSATTISGGTFYSASTNLYQIFATTGSTYLPTSKIAFGSSLSGITSSDNFKWGNTYLLIKDAELQLDNTVYGTTKFGYYSGDGVDINAAQSKLNIFNNVGTVIITSFNLTDSYVNAPFRANSLSANTITGTVITRIFTTGSTATPSFDFDTYDELHITSAATAITSMTSGLSGTYRNGRQLIFKFKDDGTARAITWGAKFITKYATLPTTTIVGKELLVGVQYNTSTSVFECLATNYSL